MPKKHQPTIEELKAAHAAESKKISDLIAEGYDFKEEHERSRKLFEACFPGCTAETMERNRQRMKKEKKREGK